MQLSFSYQKPKVIQALRYHFVQSPEIRAMLILVNVFAIVAAILFYTKNSPRAFLFGICYLDGLDVFLLVFFTTKYL